MLASFNRSKRLLTASDYRFVFSKPDFRFGNRSVLCLARLTGQNLTAPQAECKDAPAENESVPAIHRLGLAVSKKHVRKAVNRNLVKRLARERFRCSFVERQAPFAAADVVILTRSGAGKANRAELRGAIDATLSKLEKFLEHR
ncbi:MAG: ribonuclease P protein component [Pseudomonadota bacterium]